MTPVIFHIVTPKGDPIPNAKVVIELSRESFNEDGGAIMPRSISATTDVDGHVTVPLMACDRLYVMTVNDTTSCAEMQFRFLVPELSAGAESVRFQDIIVSFPVSDKNYDEQALVIIQDTKVAVLAAMDNVNQDLSTVVQAKDTAVLASNNADQKALDAQTSATTATQKAQETQLVADSFAISIDNINTNINARVTKTEATSAGLNNFSYSVDYPKGTIGNTAKNVICITDPPFNCVGDGIKDNYIGMTLADSVANVIGKRVYAPSGRYMTSKTLVFKANWYGEGTENRWGQDGRGTIIQSMGPGNPMRWTDIDGNDTNDFTPLIVMGRSGTSLEDMTVKCGTIRWSAGVYVPGTKRNKVTKVDTVGEFKKAGLYLDASWSSTNTTLTSLHPEIESDTGLNEFCAYDCFLEGLWGFLVQGTTRNPVGFAGDWVWAPGGTSDLSGVNLRMGSCSTIPVAERMVDGGGFKHNAAVNNAAGAGQGHNFVNCTLRTKSKYLIHLDRSNRDMWVNTYAETIGNNDTGANAVIAITDNTGTVSLVNDNISGPITFNGVEVASSTSGYRWASTRRLSVTRAFGSAHLPFIYGGMSTGVPLELISGEATGTIQFSQNINNGSFATTPYARIFNSGFRPEVAYGMSLGTTSFPFQNVIASEGRFNTLLLNGTPVTAPSNGTWTPTIVGSTVAGANTYTLQSGSWSKGAGNMIHVSGAITLSGLLDVATTGNLQIGGLPFPSKSGSNTWAGVSFSRMQGMNLTAGTVLVGQMGGGAQTINLIERNNVGDTILTAISKFGANAQLRFDLTYEI